MTFSRHNRTILEVSIASDALYKPDGFLNAAHESESHSFVVHNVKNPEWAALALQRVRHVKHVVNLGVAAIDVSSELHMIKVLYDSEHIDTADNGDRQERLEAFRKSIVGAVERSGIAYSTHL